MTVYRFLVVNSIEGKMIRLQKKKTDVINQSLGKSQGPTVEDFNDIFDQED